MKILKAKRRTDADIRVEIGKLLVQLGDEQMASEYDLLTQYNGHDELRARIYG